MTSASKVPLPETSPSSSSFASWESARESSPTSPGVYWFLDQAGDVLYVGKAKNLKKRLTQYALLQDQRPQIQTLVDQTRTINVQEFPSELEALLVEAELIWRYQPPYNVLLKDDKSDLYICITKDSFPRIFTARKPEVLRSSQKLTVFGPFPSLLRVRQVLSIARRMFPWCDKPETKKPCFYYHLGLCSGACVGEVSQEDYQAMIKQLQVFLHGKTGQLKQILKQEIKEASERQAYEQAAIIRDQLDNLERVTSPKYRLAPDMVLPVLTQNLEQEALVSLRSLLRQYVTLPATAPLSRIEGYDISNIQGTNATSSMVVAIDGKMTSSEYRHFGIKTIDTPNDYQMMKETLTRRQQHPEWGIPDIVVIDGGKGQLRAAKSVWTWDAIVVSIAKRPDRLIISLPHPTKATYKEIPLTPDLPATRLIQSIRDESHRFAKRLHTIKRNAAILS